jgi:WD40 repeat protein
MRSPVGSGVFAACLAIACVRASTPPATSAAVAVSATVIPARPQPIASPVVPPWAKLVGVRPGADGLVHPGINHAAFAGERLVTLAESGEVRVWSLASRSLAAVWPAPRGHALSLAVEPSTQLVAVGDGNGWVSVRRLPDGRPVLDFKAHDAPVRLVAFRGPASLVSYAHQSERHVAAKIRDIKVADEAGGELRSWRVPSGERAGEIWLGGTDGEDMNDQQSAIALSPNGARVAAATRGALAAWDIDSGRMLWSRPRKQTPRGLYFVADDTLVMLAFEGSGKSVLEEIDARGGRSRSKQTLPQLDVVAAHPPSQRAVIRGVTSLLLADVRGRQGTFTTRTRDPQACNTVSLPTYRGVFSPDGSLFATWGGGGNSTLALWDTREREPKLIDAGHARAHARVAIAADGTRAVVAHQNHTARLVDLRGDGAELARVCTRAELPLAVFSRDGARWLVVDEKTVTARDVDGDRAAWTLDATLVRGAAPRLSPDGTVMAVLKSEGGLSLFEAATAKPLWRRGQYTYDRDVLGFSPDGAQVIAFDERSQLGIWDVRTGRSLGGLTPAPGPLDRNAPGAFAMSTDGRGVLIVDGRRHQVEYRLNDSRPYDVVLTRDGRRALLAHHPRLVTLWDVDGVTESGRIDFSPTHDSPSSLALTPDDRHLLVGTLHGAVYHFALSIDAADPHPNMPPHGPAP